jgi:GTP-binding protein Era
MNGTEATFKSGFIAIVGRPNVGKSTLMNELIGVQLSIATRKPQTTRNRILGVITLEDRGQLVFVDTPGIHSHSGQLNRRMVNAAYQAAGNTDVILFVVDVRSLQRFEDQLFWGDDEAILEALQEEDTPVVLALNKVDLLDQKEELLPLLDRLSEFELFDALVPVSAKKGDNTDAVIDALIEALPAGPPLYSEDTLTDRAERFFAAEIVREALLLKTGQEVPYATAVTIERFDDLPNEDRLEIDAVITVERGSQKGIVIGKGGKRLKAIGIHARKRMEEFFDRHVYLNTLVQVKDSWTENTRALSEFGYGKEEI